MSEKWEPPGAPNVKQDFNEAAKQQVNKDIPPPSDKGISSKAEMDKRIENSRILRERLERQNAPTLKPKTGVTKSVDDALFKKDKKAFEENEATKQEIALRLKRKKDQEMHREFNRSANPSKD